MGQLPNEEEAIEEVAAKDATADQNGSEKRSVPKAQAFPVVVFHFVAWPAVASIVWFVLLWARC